MGFEYSEQKKDEKQNNTGIPDNMKKRFEAFSSISFDDVKVHYNSKEPAKLNALAYTRGTQVYIAPGQDKHLPHELGHVVQQKKGIVPVTSKINGVPVNDSRSMENAADEISYMTQNSRLDVEKSVFNKNASQVVQRYAIATMTGQLGGKTKTVYGKSGNRLGTKAVMESFSVFNDAFKRVVCPKILRRNVETSEDRQRVKVADITPLDKREAVQTEYYKLEEESRDPRRSEQEKDIMEINAEINKIGDPDMILWIFSKEDFTAAKDKIARAMKRDKTAFLNEVLRYWDNYWQTLQSMEYERCNEDIRSAFFMGSRKSLLRNKKVKIEENKYVKISNSTKMNYGEWMFLETSYNELLEAFMDAAGEIKICSENLDEALIEILIQALNKTVISKLAFGRSKTADIKTELIGYIINKLKEFLEPIPEIMQKHSQIIFLLNSKEHVSFVNSLPLNYNSPQLLAEIEKNDRDNPEHEGMDAAYELRSPYKCAEPNALAIMLLAFNEEEDMEKIENLYNLLNSISISVEDKEYGTINMRPCPVCEQWVSENGKVKDSLKRQFQADDQSEDWQ